MLYTADCLSYMTAQIMYISRGNVGRLIVRAHRTILILHAAVHNIGSTKANYSNSVVTVAVVPPDP